MGNAQSKQERIVGTVIEEDGSAVANTTVTALNSGDITLTDNKGRFEIVIIAPDTLVFSSLGYKQELIHVRSGVSDLKIVLTIDETIIDVIHINTGYQQLKPNQINGAITVIDNETLNKQVGLNILSRLEGLTNGLTFQKGRANTNPQNSTGITVRGYSTINGPLDPLIVVDNFVYDGDIENIDPNNVESVSVLKDAAATSIYGARGGNGVIVITTKKGINNDKTNISFNTNWSLIEKPNLYKLPIMSNESYIGVEELLFKDGYFNGDVNSTAGTVLTPIVHYLNQKIKGNISEEEYLEKRQFYADVNLRDQYTERVYKLANIRQYGLNINGGSDVHRWMINTNRNDQRDSYGAPSNRTNLRTGNSFVIGKKINVDLTTSYTRRDVLNSNQVEFNDLMQVRNRQRVPYMSLINEDGEHQPFYQYWNKEFIDAVGNGKLLDWSFYPLTDPAQTKFYNSATELLGNIGINYQPLTGLKLGLYYQIQEQTNKADRHYLAESYYTRDMINKFSEVNKTSGEIIYNVPKGDILYNSKSRNWGQSMRAQADLNRRFSEHAIKAILGFELRETAADGSSWTNYGYNNDPLTFVPVNHTVRYQTFPLGIANTIPGSPVIEPTLVNKFVSVYGNMNYTLADKYSFSGSFRKDGSNIYGVSTNDKWKPLWSVGVGYDVGKEDFLSRRLFDHLRMRTSLGYSGNVDLSRSALPIAYYSNNQPDDGGLRAALIQTLNNPSLRWEQIRQVNFGLDFKLHGFPLSGTVDFYTKYGTDLYGLTDYDYTQWGRENTLVKNVAEMKGKGVDVQLNFNKDWNKFHWYSSIIYNYSLSKTHKYYDDSEEATLSRLTGLSAVKITPVEGYPFYSIAALVWKGLDERGDPLGYVEGAVSKDYTAIINSSWLDGENGGAVKYVGSGIPLHFGSWRNDFRWGDFTVGFNLTYKLGYYFKRTTINYSSLVNSGLGHSDFEKRWKNPGDKTDVPSFEYPLTTRNRDAFHMGSENLVERADHIRLQYINVGYDIPTANWRTLPKRINLYLNLANIGIIWKANDKGLDPEHAYAIPLQKNLSFGIRTNF